MPKKFYRHYVVFRGVCERANSAFLLLLGNVACGRRKLGRQAFAWAGRFGVLGVALYYI